MTAHLPASTVHVERFVAAMGPARDGGFTVECGKSAEVQPGESTGEALRGVGIPLATSCSMGVCGTCRTRVLAGTPDHRDGVLTEEQRTVEHLMTPCCSGALGHTLVLDL